MSEQTNNQGMQDMATKIASENRYEHIEHDVIKLPSRGLFYPKDAEENPIKTVRVAYLTAEDENLLLSPNLIQSGEMLDVLLRNKVIDTKINADDLLEGDRLAILFWLRSTGISNEYTVMLKDIETGKPFEHTFDLQTLDYKKFDEGKINADGTINGSIDVNGKHINFRYKHLTHRELLTFDKEIEERNKKISRKIDDRITRLCFTKVVEFDGQTDKGEIQTKIKSLRLPVFRALQKELSLEEPGINTEVEVRTPSGNFHPYEIPFGIEFLYPDL